MIKAIIKYVSVTVVLLFICFFPHISFATEAVIDSFEYDTVGNYWFTNNNPAITTFATSTEQVKVGSKALKVVYKFTSAINPWGTIVSKQYATGGTPFPTMPNGNSLDSIGIWVYGDNSNSGLTLSIQDNNNETFKYSYTSNPEAVVNWTGWKYVKFNISDYSSASGGDSKLDFPLKLYQFVISKNNCANDVTNTLYFDDISISYSQKINYSPFEDLGDNFEYSDPSSRWFLSSKPDTAGNSLTTSNEVIHNGERSLQLIYNYSKGINEWINITSQKFADKGLLMPYDNTKVVKSLGMWVYGDNSGVKITTQVTDVKGETFKYGGTSGLVINWAGWKYVEFGINDYYSKDGDGIVDMPLRLYQFTVSNPATNGIRSGSLYFDNLGVNYAKSVALSAFEDASNFQYIGGGTVNSGVSQSHSGGTSMEFNYNMTSPEQTISIISKTDTSAIIEKHSYTPKGIGLWVYGDNSGYGMRIDVKGANGATYLGNIVTIDFNGWKYVEFNIDENAVFPVNLQQISIIKTSSQPINSGTIYLDDASVLYATTQQVTCSINDGSKDVDAYQEVLLNFNNDMIDSTVTNNSITVEKNGESFTDYTIEKITEKQYKLVLGGGLSYNSSYTITVTDKALDVFGQYLQTQINFKTMVYAMRNIQYYNNGNSLSNISNLSTGTLTVNTNVCNYSNVPQSIDVVAALYEVTSMGYKMKSIKGVPEDVAVNGNVNVSVELPVTAINSGSKYVIYTFLWDGLTMRPMIDPVVFGGDSI